MTSNAAAGFQDKALVQQGYDYSPAQLREVSWGLRFTPFVCMLGAIYGLATQQASVHFALAVLGIIPFWFPAHNPVDLFYNYVLRPIWRGVKLPPNPLPRRIACLLGGAMNVGIGLAFYFQVPTVAYLLGAMLIPLQIIVITTHFCVASWLYEALLRLVGGAVPLIPVDQAREKVAQGARLIDVRSPVMFAQSHIEGAANVPLDELESHVKELQAGPVIVYCQRGFQSQVAARKLIKRGCSQVFNLGSIDRWS